MGKYGKTISEEPAAESRAPARGKYGAIVPPREQAESRDQIVHGRKRGVEELTDAEIQERGGTVRSENDPLTPPVSSEQARESLKNRHAPQGLGESVGRIALGAVPVVGGFMDPDKHAAAKEQHPIPAAVTDTIVKIAPYLIAKGRGGPAGTMAIAGSQGATEGYREGGVGGALAGGTAAAATGGLLHRAGMTDGAGILARMARTAPAVAGAGFGVAQATAPGATTFDRWQGGLGALSPPGLNRASKGSRRSAALEPERVKALDDTRALAQEQVQKGGMERAALDDAAMTDVQRQNAATTRQNVSRTDAATAAEKADFTDARIADRKAMQDHNDALRTADDAQMRTHNDAATAKRTADKAANMEHRLRGIDFADDFAKRTADYEQAKSNYDAYTQAAKARGEDVAARASLIKAVNATEQSLREAHVKEGDDLRAAIEALKTQREGATESARAYYANLHGELYDRATRHVAGSQALGQEPSSDIIGSLRYLATKHESLSPERFAKLDDYAADPDAAVTAEAARRRAGTDAEMQSLSDRLNAGPEGQGASPDFKAQATQQVAAKAAVKAKAEADARAAAEGEVAPLGEAPPEPVRPDRSAHDQASRDFARAKIAAGETPLPPKPDTLATRGAIRQNAADFRNAPGFDPAQSRGRSDPGLVQPTRAAIDPLVNETPAQRKAALDTEILRMLAAGESRVKGDLDTARMLNKDVAKTPGKQFVRETRSPLAGQAAKTVGGMVGGALVGGPAGAAIGGVVGNRAGGKPSTEAVLRYMARTKSDTRPEGFFAEPAEAHAVLTDAQRHHNRGSMSLDRAASGKVGAASIGAQALMQMLLKAQEDEGAPK